MRGVLGMGDIAKHPEPAKSESTWSTMKEGEWVVRIQGRGYPLRTPKDQSTSGNFNFGF